MTNKQIIIDGVDVNALYSDQIACMNRYEVARLFIKIVELLVAKEQEYEELKKQYNCYACDTCKGKEDYINLKRHCENAIKSLHNKYAEFDQLKAENEELKKRVKGEIHLGNRYKEDFVEQFNEAEKYKQTLIEIKEIAEETSQAKFRNNACIGCAFLNDKILQKISEVIPDEKV